jgi:hypothetical protein
LAWNIGPAASHRASEPGKQESARTFRKVGAGPMFDPGFRAVIAGAASWGWFAKQRSKYSFREHARAGSLFRP